ncbi:MAG: hypothetical protein M3068_10965 [Gemmatimonadota bacterium]|nr:hypothetical protein [Gemmatimonadota bacterium]
MAARGERESGHRPDGRSGPHGEGRRDGLRRVGAHRLPARGQPRAGDAG